MIKIVRAYNRLLRERPLITNVLTTPVFTSLGDMTSQCILQGKENWDPYQTARFAASGLLFIGPVARGLMVMIDRIFGPTKSVNILVRKLCFDQLICTPIFLAGNLTLLTSLKTQSVEGVKQEFSQSYFTLLRLNYSFWPFVQAVNFYFIPLSHRVLFGSSAAYIYNVIFSYTLNLSSMKKVAQTIVEDDVEDELIQAVE